MYYSTTYLSPLGKITLACDACGKNLVGLWLEGQKYYQGTLKEALIEKDAVPLCQKSAYRHRSFSAGSCNGGRIWQSAPF